ncbi:MAG: RDD family protein [Acidimicrobiia bacterium]
MKEIKNPRSREAQGTRAGFVSQAISMVLDAAWILFEYFVLLVVFGIVRGLFTSSNFAVPKPPTWASIVALFVIGVATWEAAWSGSGRAPGMGVLGLRVVAADGSALSPRRAFWRSVIVTATLGLLVVTTLFSRTNRSWYDKWCGSAVVYDWRPAGPVVSS